jgi:phosphoglycolate phosphatase
VTSHRLRLVVFDLDGTLVDSLLSIQSSMKAAADRVGLPSPDLDRVRDVVGLPLREAVGALFADAPEAAWDGIVSAYKDAFWEATRSGRDEHALFPGAAECLEVLDAAGFLLGIATSKGRRGVDIVLDSHRLTGRFVTLQTGDQLPGKPHPEMLHRAMREAGVEAGDTVMVGDTSYDMKMAKAARVAAIGVSWGYHAVPGLRTAGADQVVDRFDDLPPAVDRAFGVAGVVR